MNWRGGGRQHGAAGTPPASTASVPPQRQQPRRESAPPIEIAVPARELGVRHAIAFLAQDVTQMTVRGEQIDALLETSAFIDAGLEVERHVALRRRRDVASESFRLRIIR